MGKTLFVGLLLIAAAITFYINPTLLFSIVVPLAIYEFAAIVSAVLDYKESRLTCVGWKQWWQVGHATVVARFYRRVRHVVRGVTSSWHRRQLRIATTPPEQQGYVVLDPTTQFTGRVIDLEPRDAPTGSHA